MKKITALIKEPGADPELREIDNTLSALQQIVGGYIETLTLFEDVVVICNEDGRLIGLEENCSIFGLNFVGTIAIVLADGDEFASWDLDLVASRMLFPEMWI